MFQLFLTVTTLLPPADKYFTLSPFTRTNLAKSRDNSAPALPFSSLSSPYKSGLKEDCTQIHSHDLLLLFKQLTTKTGAWPQPQGDADPSALCCLTDEFILPGSCSLTPRTSVAVTPHGQTPDVGAGAIVKRKKGQQMNVAVVLLQEAMNYVSCMWGRPLLLWTGQNLILPKALMTHRENSVNPFQKTDQRPLAPNSSVKQQQTSSIS